ncbi:MAG: ABC transporter substrate-binding protein [candidate division NC10 bacterium]|jgi:phospholipid transport system substrate-binding protein
MRQVIRKTLILCGISVLVFSSLSFADDGPTAQVKSTVDRVLEILKEPALKSPDKEETRGKQLKKVIFARFDFDEMAKRSLGVHWRERTPQERKEFVKIFADLLELSYRRKIERYTDEEIQYTKEQVDEKFGVVTTEIVSEKEGVDIPIDYKVIRRGDEWKVYDVVIDGISLVGNYRSQFNRIILRSSYAELVKKMRIKQETEAEEIGSPSKQ